MGGWVKPNTYVCLQGGWVGVAKCLRNHKNYRISWKDQINMRESLHEFAFFELQNVHFFSSQSNIKNYFEFKFSSSKGSISDFRKWKQWYKIIFSLKFLPVYPLFNFRKKTLEGVKKHLHSSPFQSIILEIITQISRDLQRFYSLFAERSKWEVFSKDLLIVQL